MSRFVLAYLTKQVAIFGRDEALCSICLPVEGILEMLEGQRIVKNIDHLLRKSVCERLGRSRCQKDWHASYDRKLAVLAESIPRSGTDAFDDFGFNGTEKRFFLGILFRVLTLAKQRSTGS